MTDDAVSGGASSTFDRHPSAVGHPSSDIRHLKGICMAEQRLGIIMNGVTGRMGMNQHLIRSILAIRAQGGVALRNGDTVMPDPILVGRNEGKLAQLANAHGIARWTTTLDATLKNLYATGYFYNISVAQEPTDKGIKLVYSLQGNPVLTEIKFVGNTKFKNAKLLKKVTSKIGQSLDDRKLFTDAQEMAG